MKFCENMKLIVPQRKTFCLSYFEQKHRRQQCGHHSFVPEDPELFVGYRHEPGETTKTADMTVPFKTQNMEVEINDVRVIINDYDCLPVRQKSD